eukprot:GHRR01000660.1.p1 GENE.GHRR01000660.1~~GHRR01000660.1.p1  ORF type:complete len:576 (+),score=135.60 GHRR01000660.1:200-1927(+)
MAGDRMRLLHLLLVAAGAVALLATVPAAADADFSKLAAVIGAAAATSATAEAAKVSAFSHAPPASAMLSDISADTPAPSVLAYDNPLQDDEPTRTRWASQLREQLANIFKDRPAALERIQSAWDAERGFGFTRFGMRDPPEHEAATQSEPDVEAMDVQKAGLGGLPDATKQAINAVYEADHPQFESRMEQLVPARGYPLERHAVVTPDGYELIMYRVPYGAQRNNQPGKRPVVFLQHGVTLASDSFAILNQNESLAFILADAGFDVWMGNTRGNTYSRRNLQGLYAFQLEFWYFGLDQLALLDLSTMVDFALATSGASKLGYVGHSQGCTLAYLLCAAKPEYNNKFSVLAHLGPVVFVDFFRAVTLRALAIISADQFLYLLRIGEFLPNRLTAPLYGTLCPAWPLDEVCTAALSLIFFGPSLFITPDDYISIATTWPSSVGSRNLVHWAQNFRTPELELRQYDFGTACNLTEWKPGRGFIPKPFKETCNQYAYGTLVPPAYDFTKVTCPNVIFSGEVDVVSVATDIEEEVRRLGSAFRGDFVYSDYSHMDFVWDRNSKHSVDLADVFFRFSPGTF